MYLGMFETYLLRNGWTDLKNSFFVSSVLVRGRFQAKKYFIFYYKIVKKITNFLKKNKKVLESPETSRELKISKKKIFQL